MNSGASNNNLDQLNAIILEQAPDAIVVIDEQLRLIKANHKAYQLFGYSQKELIGMPINELDGFMNASMIGSVVQQVKSEGSVTFESKALRKDGVLIPLEIKCCFVNFGEKFYLIAFARDISERVKAREALEKEKGFMDALMDNVPESIFFKDSNSRLTRVSKKLMQDLNCTDPAELIGKTDIEIFGEEFGRKTMAIEQQILETGEPRTNMMEQRYREDGTIIWTLTTKAPIKDETGAVTGIVGIAREINEIKEREEQLQAKEAQLSIASHIAGLGYWEFNVDEGFYTFNDHFYRIFHTSVEEVGGYIMTPTEYVERFLFPEDRDLVAKEIKKALQVKVPEGGVHLEHRIQYPDGTAGYIAVRYFLTTNDEGRIVKIYGANQNITERKLAQKAVEKIKDQLTVAAQIAKLGYWEYDADKQLFTFNDQFYAIFKTTVEEVGGYELDPIKYGELFLFPEDRELAAREVQAALDNPNSEYHRYLEHRIRYATGEEGYVGVRFFAVKDEKGDTTKTIGVNQDITERKLVELALKDREISLQRAFEIAAIGPVKYNIRMDQYEWTQQAIDVLEFRKEDIPKTFAELLAFVHPDDVSKIRDEVERANKFGVFDLEHRMMIYGKLKWVRFKSQVEFDDQGQPDTTVGSVIDITKRKLAEQELFEYRDHLEHLVQQRTVQLEDINKDLEAFAYSISHDLRAPLRHINGFANILKRRLEEEDKEIRKYIGMINDASNRMGTMIDGLLHFSRLGRQEINSAKVDLNVLVSEVVKNFRPDVEHRNFEWKISHLPTVHGDVNLLKIVFENLLSNAIKYTRNREHAIVEVGVLNPKEQLPTLFVRDNGVGFDMAYADKLFGVFQRLHREEDFEGTGIGLANVYQIIKKHGGTVRAVGELNKGATFYLTF